MKTVRGILLAGGITLAMAMPAQSAIIDQISFGGWTSNDSVDVTPTFDVGLDDGGFFVVDVWFSGASAYQGEISGIFFDLGVDNFAESNISYALGYTGPTHTDYATDTDRINGVTTINPFSDFDVILGYKPFADEAVQFLVDATGLSLDDWTRVGVRWQNTNAPEGSDKVVSFERLTVDVAEPATMGLLFAGVAGLLFSRRKLAR